MTGLYGTFVSIGLHALNVIAYTLGKNVLKSKEKETSTDRSIFWVDE